MDQSLAEMAKFAFNNAKKHLDFVKRPAVGITSVGVDVKNATTLLDEPLEELASNAGLHILYLIEPQTVGFSRWALLSRVSSLTDEQMIDCRAGNEEPWLEESN